MNRQKHERIPDEYRETGLMQKRTGGRHETYTDFFLYGRLTPIDPEIAGRINGK